MNYHGYNLTVFEEPIPGATYAIGGDPAEGLERGDDSVLEGINCDSGEHAFELYGKIEPVAFGEHAFKLGTWYNNALIGVENNIDNTANRVLHTLGYSNIYREQREVGRAYRSPTDKLGWNTNLRTRPQLIAMGRKWMSDGSAICRSTKLTNQFKNFALHGKKFQGLPGSHDDFVMAWLIAIEMVNFQLEMMQAHENKLVPLAHGQPIRQGGIIEWDESHDISYSERLIAQVHSKDRHPDFKSGMGSYVG